MRTSYWIRLAKVVGDFLLGIQRPAPNVTVRYQAFKCSIVSEGKTHSEGTIRSTAEVSHRDDMVYILRKMDDGSLTGHEAT